VLALRVRIGRLFSLGLAVAAIEYLILSVNTALWQLYVTQALDALVVAAVLGLGLTYAQQLSPGRAGLASSTFGVPCARVRLLAHPQCISMDEPRKRVAAMMSGLDIQYDLGEGHPLLGRRIPDLELVTANGPLRVFTLLHAARPVLLERFAESEQRIGERGGIAGCGGDKKADRAVAQVFGESADEAEIDEADDGRVLGPDHDVAGMWIGMEEPVLKHHLRDHVQRVACDLLAERRICDLVDARPEEAYAPPNQAVICWQAGKQEQGIQN
jgi:hypothetical protein